MVSVAPTGCEEDVVVKAEAMEEEEAEEKEEEEEEEEEAPDEAPLLVLLSPLLLNISDRNEQHQPAHGVTNNKIPIPDRYLFGNLENPRRPPTSTAQKMYNRVSNQPRDNVINVILIKKITKTATVLPIREFRLLLENFFWPCLEVGAEEAEEVEEAGVEKLFDVAEAELPLLRPN